VHADRHTTSQETEKDHILRLRARYVTRTDACAHVREARMRLSADVTLNTSEHSHCAAGAMKSNEERVNERSDEVPGISIASFRYIRWLGKFTRNLSRSSGD